LVTLQSIRRPELSISAAAVDLLIEAAGDTASHVLGTGVSAELVTRANDYGLTKTMSRKSCAALDLLPQRRCAAVARAGSWPAARCHPCLNRKRPENATGCRVPVFENRKPVTIAPPLIGPNWLNGDGCCDTSAHGLRITKQRMRTPEHLCHPLDQHTHRHPPGMASPTGPL
jgi:hypothetical protein